MVGVRDLLDVSIFPPEVWLVADGALSLLSCPLPFDRGADAQPKMDNISRQNMALGKIFSLFIQSPFADRVRHS